MEISRYLKKKVSYKKYTSFSALKKAAAKKNKCRIIMSTWNKPITDGLHTFYVYKIVRIRIEVIIGNIIGLISRRKD
ncbi:MAG: hypothetical protein K2M78_08780 [Lachnospiraceae bacterium]|nr:hypothetical protein [Lachnospiraceae bacterium]